MHSWRVWCSAWLPKVNSASGLGFPSLAPAWLGFSSLVHHSALPNRRSSSKRGSRWTGRRGTWETLCRSAAWRTKSTSRPRSSSPKGDTACSAKHPSEMIWSEEPRLNLPLRFQIPEVSDQEVSEEEQPPWLAQGRGVRQGDVRAALLPDQPGGRRVGGRRVTEQQRNEAE